jgi:hypothetical protein
MDVAMIAWFLKLAFNLETERVLESGRAPIGNLGMDRVR